VSKLAFDDTKEVPYKGSDMCCGFLSNLIGFAKFTARFLELLSFALLYSNMLRCLACFYLFMTLYACVTGISKDHLFFTMQQVVSFTGITDVGGCTGQTVLLQ